MCPCRCSRAAAQASRSTNARGPGAVRSRHTGTEPNRNRAQLPLLGALQKHSLQQQELEAEPEARLDLAAVRKSRTTALHP